ncbi:MAG: proton-conducting transporter membrane subunit [Bdellovibrionota bacterium]
MSLLIASLIVLLLTGAAALFTNSRPSMANRIGPFGCVLGGAMGIVPTIMVFFGSPALSFKANWNIPYGNFFIELDALTALFLLIIFFFSILLAFYGSGYLKPYLKTRSIGTSWFFFNILIVSMALVVLARNAMLFLIAWEIMALSSFFLVTFEDEKESVRRAGWIYLVATHIGTALLLLLFIYLGKEDGAMDFDRFKVPVGMANMLFILAVLGFGSKAGFMPLHVWLPEAHPAAPSHVSALMSGVMIKTGIYGFLRIVTMLGGPPQWWGIVLIIIGVTSGIGGILFALAQHDSKRLLALSSVENIGIIALGIGLGLLGQSLNSPVMTFAGYGGALLHVLNHAVFKGLLFLGAGVVFSATGTREIDELGGLMKRMPAVGTTFLIGATAISGLPPLNGFVSEFLIYLSAFSGLTSWNAAAVPALITILGLALIGGLASACFAKIFGVMFLGTRRQKYDSTHEHPVGFMMKLPMYVLAALCVAGGILGPWMMKSMESALAVLTKLPMQTIGDYVSTPLLYVAGVNITLLAVIGLLAILRKRLLRTKTIGTAVTWDCGYAYPTSRMQYTASSFTQPLCGSFQFFLRTKNHHHEASGTAVFATETRDWFLDGIFKRMFLWFDHRLSFFRRIQHGRIQLYILYIVITLLALVLWKMRLP